MKIADDSPPIVSALDRPNSYIGPFPQDTPINASFPCVSKGNCLPYAVPKRFPWRVA